MLRSQATEAMLNNDWYGAWQYYGRLYERDSLDVKLQYNYAEASRLSLDYETALRLYTKVSLSERKNKFPLAHFWIGQVLKGKEKYKEAKKSFAKFLSLDLKKDKYKPYNRRARLEMETCDFVQILKNNPLPVKVEHLEPIINTKLSEYAAFEKDSTLYFSSVKVPDKRDPNVPDPEHLSKIYKSDFRKNRWQKVKALDTLINNPRYHNSNTTFSPDGKMLVVSRCISVNASDYRCDLYQSQLINNKWREAVRMEEPVNQVLFSTTQAHFAQMDGKTVLFFSSNRPGGQGGMDIWYCLKKEDGRFSEALNAGKGVNTAEDEITPWYVSESSTLYFSSNGHKNFGGFDIFKSSFNGGSFSEAQNAGYPINSGYNEVYYSVNSLGSKTYFSSNRPGSNFEGKLNCCNDIYRFSVDTSRKAVPQVVIDSSFLAREQMKLLVPLTLYFHNDEPDPNSKSISTVLSYQKCYEDYILRKPEYERKFSEKYLKKEKSEAVSKVQNFFSDSVESSFHDLETFLNKLQTVLLNKEEVTITLKGYASPLGSVEYNKNLARRRISSLRNYFNTARNGWFVKYINNPTSGAGKIVFEEVEIGELKESKASDNLKDQQNSVYSPLAASERKIQIIAVSFDKK